MSGDDDKTQLQDLRAELDGLVTDLKTIHERMDSSVTTANERFEQLDLAQTATKTTLDTIVSRLDALNTVVTELWPKDVLVTMSQRTLTAVAKLVVYHAAPLMIPFLILNLKFHLSMVNMILLHILIGS
jgi:hypothetical protein